MAQKTQKILSRYDRMVKTVRLRMLEEYPAKLVWKAFADTRVELETLIPLIPSIGEQNIWQQNLDASVMSLALARALKKQSFTHPEIAQMIYRVFETYLLSFPKFVRRAYGWYYFSGMNQARLRKGAAISQRRSYPQDWVYTFREGDGQAFDMGVDITECAILKFFRAQEAEELVPHLCKLDHAMGRYLGLGFTRQGTLAEGAALCDCRWKRGVETLGWEPAWKRARYEESSPVMLTVTK